MAEPNILSKSSSALDASLAALFASSSRPLQLAKESRYSDQAPRHGKVEDDQIEGNSPNLPNADNGDRRSKDDGDGRESAMSGSSSDADDDHRAVLKATALPKPVISKSMTRTRKRKRSDELSPSERKHLQKVYGQEEEQTKRPKMAYENGSVTVEDDESGVALVHESLLANSDEGDDKGEVQKANRTVFLSNVSTEAVTSKRAKKQLLAHLTSVLDGASSPSQRLISLRFRSVPLSTAAMPKRAAVITQAVMTATTKSTNAYAVYSDAAAARIAVSKLNGTVVLDRHLRVDSVAHPSPIAHKRCVFVGNLGFVDDESVINLAVDGDGGQSIRQRKRTQTPMDVEEGLWRTFGQAAGRIENVRVVRDQATRVGKGIAYVQFYDVNSVEAALLLDGKKFPPLLPRELRVARCKAPHKTRRAVENSTIAKAASLAGSNSKSTKYVRKPSREEKTSAGRARKLLGRAGAARFSRLGRTGGETEGQPNSGDFKSPQKIVFEGRRATAKDGKPRELKIGRAKTATKALSNNKKRQASRTAVWKNRGHPKSIQ